jgi:hypothetical protein
MNPKTMGGCLKRYLDTLPFFPKNIVWATGQLPVHMDFNGEHLKKAVSITPRPVRDGLLGQPLYDQTENNPM